MSEWKCYKLNEISSLSNGINFDKSAYTSGVKLIGVSDFKNRIHPDYDSLQEVDSKVVRSGDYLEKGDIVFVRSNGNKELVGRCMMIERDIPVTYSGFCINLRLKDKKRFEPVFFNYLFRTRQFKKSMTGTAVGANIQNLSQSRLGNCEVNVPGIETQREIATILSRYDSLIENYQKQIKLLEEAEQRLYKEWFVDLHFPGHENTKIVDGVPEGWEKKNVGEVCDTTSGGTPSRSKTAFYTGNILWVKTKELNDEFIFDTEEKITDDAIRKSSAKLIPSGSILMAMYGATIGKLGIATKELSCNQACCVFLLHEDDILRFYLYNWLLDNRTMLISMGKGAAQPNLSQDMIKKLEIVIPSLHLLTIFDSKVKSTYKKVYYLSSQIRLLTEARDRLLPKLMSGEIVLEGETA